MLEMSFQQLWSGDRPHPLDPAQVPLMFQEASYARSIQVSFHRGPLPTYSGTSLLNITDSFCGFKGKEVQQNQLCHRLIHLKESSFGTIIMTQCSGEGRYARTCCSLGFILTGPEVRSLKMREEGVPGTHTSSNPPRTLPPYG